MAGDNEKSLGEFKGRTYYSIHKPHGTGKEDIPYDAKMDSVIYSLALPENRTNENVRQVQPYFADIGYLDSTQVDSYFGRKTQGAINRYTLNTQSFDQLQRSGSKKVDSIWNRFKTWKDDIMNWETKGE